MNGIYSINILYVNKFRILYVINLMINIENALFELSYVAIFNMNM